MNVGDAVLFRSIYEGNVRWCYPSRYVGDWNGRHGIYCGPGYAGKTMWRDERGGYLEIWKSGVPPIDEAWGKGHVLRFLRAGDAHTIEICWDHDWRHVCWYVNLNAPIVISGDRQELGILDAAAAAEVRAEGERVIAEKPWPTGWEDWRPPPEWGPLPLPEDWHVV